MTNCALDGCDLPVAPPQRLYCTRDHRAEARRAYYRRPPKVDRCRICGDEFAPYRGGQTLCSKADCRREDTLQRGRTARGDSAIRERVVHPTGYEPGAELAGDKGWVSSLPSEKPPERVTSWDWLLEQWHLEPSEYEVLEPVQIRTWLGAIGGGETREMYYYKANVRRRVFTEFGSTIEELRTRLRDLRSPRPKPAKGTPSTFMITIGDTQFGKADGDGTPGTVARVASLLERLPERVEQLRDSGYNLEDACVGWLGDLVENVDGHYAQQGFTTDLNLTQQVELATDAYLEVNGVLARLFPRVLNVGVPGNHGEVRKDGKSFTNLADNFDVSSLRQGQKAIDLDAGLRGRVSLAVPDGDELTMTLRVRDRVHTFLHGHQGRVGGSTAVSKIARWLEGQASGMRAPGEADFVWSGHYHHFGALESGPRMLVQSPALDGGSTWYAQTHGEEAPPGTVTAVLTGEPGIAGLAELTVIPGDPMPPRFADLVRAVIT